MKATAQPENYVWIIENDDPEHDKAKANFYIYHGKEFHYFPDHAAAKTWCKENTLQFRTEWRE